MFAQWEQMAKQVKTLSSAKGILEHDKISLEAKLIELTMQISEKDKEIEKLTAELLKANKSLMKIPPGTAALNHILSIQKPYRDKSYIGYKLLYKTEKGSTSTEASYEGGGRIKNAPKVADHSRLKFSKDSEKIVEKPATQTDNSCVPILQQKGTYKTTMLQTSDLFASND